MRKILLASVALVTMLGAHIPAHAGMGGGWKPDFYGSGVRDPELKEYITTATSAATSVFGGYCCQWGDGFILGQRYKFDRSSAFDKTETLWIVPLLDWQVKGGVYYARVWDYIQSGNYVDLEVHQDAIAPGNPRDQTIVWIGVHPTTKKLEVLCYGGRAGG